MLPSHKILVGDCLDLLRQMPARSVHCCVTSPPYYALRDYGVRERLDASSSELTELRSRPAKAASLPRQLAILLCLGFAAALEIVPALILSAVRHPRHTFLDEKPQQPTPETVPEPPETLEAPAQMLETAAGYQLSEDGVWPAIA